MATVATADVGALGDVQAMLDDVTARVARLPQRDERAAAAILRAGLRETTGRVQAWLMSVPDADERYTAQRHRVTMLQLQTALDALEVRIREDLEPLLVQGDERAKSMSARNLRKEVAAGSAAFGVGQAPSYAAMMDIDRGERALVRHYRASAKRYAHNVRTDIQRQLAIGVATRETFEEMTTRLQRHGGPRGLVSLRGVIGEPGAVAQRIEEGLFRRYRHWAERLVRTEMIAAYNRHHMYQLDEADKLDPGYQMRWDATQDSRTCTICSGMHGKTVDVGKDFRTDARGRAQKHPPAHPRCRCAAVAWRSEWDMSDDERRAAATPRAKPAPRPKHALQRKPKKLTAAGNKRIQKAQDAVEAAQWLDERSRVGRNMQRMESNLAVFEHHLAYVRSQGQADVSREQRQVERSARAVKFLRRITGKQKLPDADVTQEMVDNWATKTTSLLAKLAPHERAQLINRQLSAAPEAVSSPEISAHWTQTRHVLQAQYEADGYRRMLGTTDNKVAITTRRAGVWGTHAWNGRITMDPEPAKMAQRFAKAYADDPGGVRVALKEIAPIRKKTDAARKQYYDMRKKYSAEFTGRQERIAREWLAGEKPAHVMDALGLSKTKRKQLEGFVRARRDYFAALDSYDNHRAAELLRDAEGLRTLVHEEWHEYSPAKGEAYQGSGIVVEEVSTELMARATMEADWGVPVRYSKQGSYGKYIDPLTDEVARVYGVGHKKARDIVIDASSNLKKQPGGVGRDQLARLFLAQFPATGRGDEWDSPRNALSDKDGKPRPKYLYDLEVKINELATLSTV
jgi:SPP1 gp7 family putative phage head morphogenesis protein